jgi:hypothetical protein
MAIINGCQTNMEELIGFVAKCQRIAVDSTVGKPKHTSISELFRIAKENGKNLWTKIVFVWKEKQPMREKLAIPTQSLNIYLVSLTYVSLSYNTRLLGGPGGQATVPPKWAESWDLVGQKVAFKDADFAYADLMKPDIEDEIVECAFRIVHGGSCCEKCSKGADNEKGKKPRRPIKAPKRPRRKSSFGKAISTNPDRLYLVRSKNPARSRSEIRSSVEIVKADYDLGINSDSDSVGFDSNYLSPHRTRSPPRRSDREAPHAYEERSPRHESSARNESFEERRESPVFEPHDEEDEAEEAAMREAERRGYAAARAQIRRERKKAITEMTEGVVEEIRASQDPSRANFSPEASEPDIRTYMEVTYGVIIDLAPPEVERINASRSRTSRYASRARMSEKPKESEARSRIHERVSDSDVSSDSDSEPEIKLGFGRESKLKEERRPNSFAIPRREYTPRTEGFEGRQTSMADRDRGHSLREREMSIRDREVSLQEREMALRERERRFRERQHSTGHRDMPSAPGDGAHPIIVERNRPDWPTSGRFPEGGDYLSPEDPRRPLGRPNSYSGPEAIQIVRRDESNDERMYGPQSREYRTSDPRSRLRRLNDSDDDDISFVVEPRRR